MKNLILILCCFTILWSCKQKPTYNPFDDHFNIDKKHLLKDGMDTIIDGCGYYSLQFKNKKFTPSYQYFFGNDTLLTKGFFYTIDTITSKTTNIDSIKNLSFDLTVLNKELRKYKREILKKDNKLLLKPSDSTEMFYINYGVDWASDSTFVRGIYLYKLNKNEY